VKQNTKSIAMMVGIFLVLAIALYGCGGGGGYGSGGTGTVSTVTLVACPVSGTTDISIVSMAAGFSPDNVTVPTNTTVKWTNNDSVQHTVTSTTVPLYGAFNQTVNPAASVCLKFAATGAFNYHCTLHPTMPVGLVTVQ